MQATILSVVWKLKDFKVAGSYSYVIWSSGNISETVRDRDMIITDH